MLQVLEAIQQAQLFLYYGTLPGENNTKKTVEGGGTPFTNMKSTVFVTMTSFEKSQIGTLKDHRCLQCQNIPAPLPPKKKRKGKSGNPPTGVRISPKTRSESWPEIPRSAVALPRIEHRMWIPCSFQWIHKTSTVGDPSSSSFCLRNQRLLGVQGDKLEVPLTPSPAPPANPS